MTDPKVSRREMLEWWHEFEGAFPWQKDDKKYVQGVYDLIEKGQPMTDPKVSREEMLEKLSGRIKRAEQTVKEMPMGGFRDYVAGNLELDKAIRAAIFRGAELKKKMGEWKTRATFSLNTTTGDMAELLREIRDFGEEE